METLTISRFLDAEEILRKEFHKVQDVVKNSKEENKSS